MNESVNRKRGRPKGSKNKTSRKKEKQKKDILSAQEAFNCFFLKNMVLYGIWLESDRA